MMFQIFFTVCVLLNFINPVAVKFIYVLFLATHCAMPAGQTVLASELTLSLLAATLASADNLCKQFPPSSGSLSVLIWIKTV